MSVRRLCLFSEYSTSAIRSKSLFANWLPELLSLRSGIGFPVMGELVAHALKHKPVSYTHLDVYKRQVHTYHAGCGVLSLLNFTLGLYTGVPFAAFLRDGDVLGGA